MRGQRQTIHRHHTAESEKFTDLATLHRHHIPTKQTNFGRVWILGTIACDHAYQATADPAQQVIHRLATIGAAKAAI